MMFFPKLPFGEFADSGNQMVLIPSKNQSIEIYRKTGVNNEYNDFITDLYKNLQDTVSNRMYQITFLSNFSYEIM